MKKFLRYFGWGLLAFLVILTFVYLFNKSKTPEREYNIFEVKKVEAIEKMSVISGSIAPRDEVSIVPQIAGIVEEILCKPGQQVKAGDIIARIAVIPSTMELSQAQSSLEQARLEFDNISEKYRRDKELFEQKVIPQEEYEASKLAYDKVKNQFENAKDALNIIRTGRGRHDVKSSTTLVRATVSGIILDIPVRVGHSVIQANSFNAGTTIATIANMKDLLFKGKIDEIEVGKIHEGMPVKIIIGALDRLTLDATIEYVSPKAVVEGGSSLFTVEAAIKLEDISNIRAGMSANAEIITGSAYNVLAVPESAVVFVGDSAFVDVVENETSRITTRRAVDIGVSNGINVEIKKGLSEHEYVRGGEKVLK